MKQRKRKIVLLCSLNSLAMRVEAHGTQTVIPSGDSWLSSSWTLHRQFYQKLVFSQRKKKQQQTPKNLCNQANLKQDMTSVVLLPWNRAIIQCHVNGSAWQRRLFARTSAFFAWEVLDMVTTDQKLLTSTHVLSELTSLFLPRYEDSPSWGIVLKSAWEPMQYFIWGKFNWVI